jgi:LAS superfamily LD-carboxypeptidase LdcB
LAQQKVGLLYGIINGVHAVRTKGFVITFLIVLLLLSFTVPADAALDLNRLSAKDIKAVQRLLAKLAPLVKERREEQNLAALTFEELYAPLGKTDRDFLRSFQNLDAAKLDIALPYRGIAAGKQDLVNIRGQKIISAGKPRTLPPQFLTKQVYQSYTEMMDAMQKDIGRRLYIESGYRSSAYQLYLFIYYLKNHDYSIKETAKFVALPGYSEHGDPNHQAIDFINEYGINQDSPNEFIRLPEYRWLLANAQKFGFVLSYPENSAQGIAFEPWHWHYEKQETGK